MATKQVNVPLKKSKKLNPTIPPEQTLQTLSTVRRRRCITLATI
jgi:hypothetical protein